MSGVDLEAERLQRRLERERSARAEAERIAEKALRDLYRANQELDRRVLERTAEVGQARHEAAQSDAARSEFLRILSREMRTPLNGLLGMIELVSSRAVSDQDRLWAQSASDSASTLHEIATRLLLYVDLDRPHPDPPEVLAVATLVRDAATACERAALASGQLLVVEDRSEPDVESVGYPLLVRAIVDEVLGNAVQHADPGPLAVSISIDGDRNVIEIRDSGPGFDGADRLLTIDRIASPSDNLRGLGYSLVAKLAHRTKADVSIESSPGSATVVRIGLGQAADFDVSGGSIR